MGVLEKHRHILDFTLASVGRRLGRNLALIAVYALVVFLLASVLFVADGLKREATLLLGDAPEMVVQRLVAGRQDTIPVAYVAEIERIRGVQAVAPRLWGYYTDGLSGANYTVMAHRELDAHPGSILVGGGVSRRHEPGQPARTMRTGDTLPFRTYDGSALSLRVKGILPAESELLTADLVLMGTVDFQKLFAFPADQATDLAVRARNPRELATIAAKIGQLHPETRTVTRDDLLRTYEAVFDWRSGVVLLVLSGGFLAFVILAWDKATGLSAEEKREIGILKAVGWETADILVMKGWEGAVISLAAFFLGLLCAYGHVFVLPMPLFAPFMKGWAVLYPAFRLTPVLSGSQLAVLFFLTVLPYTVATIVPAWRSATIDPDVVMRG